LLYCFIDTVLPESTMKRSFCCALLLIPAAFFVFAPRAAAQNPCEALAKLKLTGATISSATLVPAGTFKPPTFPGAPPFPYALPAFCRVQGVATPTTDSNIRFEVWLPASNWNGKFNQVGNGGFAGSIPLTAMAAPLIRGYATAGTDDGHEAFFTDASWAVGHPEKLIDFAYRAVHETSVQAKAIISAFYGKEPADSYFVGCSDGGREALMEAQRYPNDFIGIVAGAPANSWTRLLATAVWVEQAVRNDTGSVLSPAKLSVLQKAAVASCDKLDGVPDGILENPNLCHFDPVVVQCKSGDGPDCLTAAQVRAAKKIYQGPRNPRTHKQVFPGYAPGTEAIPINWPVWLTGGPNPQQLPLAWLFGNSFFGNIIFNDPHWDFRTLNFDSHIKLADENAGFIGCENPNLTPFKARGGKLIQFHGWGDAAIPPQSSIDYFKSVQARMKGGTAGFYRLFMVPGLSHCSDGIGATEFGQAPSPTADPAHDYLSALDRWVKDGIAPDSFIATGTVPGDPAKTKMTHLLCPYPQVARYKGSGDIHDAASFVCRASRH
jgi:feruloyl esterase